LVRNPLLPQVVAVVVVLVAAAAVVQAAVAVVAPAQVQLRAVLQPEDQAHRQLQEQQPLHQQEQQRAVAVVAEPEMPIRIRFHNCVDLQLSRGFRSNRGPRPSTITIRPTR